MRSCKDFVIFMAVLLHFSPHFENCSNFGMSKMPKWYPNTTTFISTYWERLRLYSEIGDARRWCRFEVVRPKMVMVFLPTMADVFFFIFKNSPKIEV